MEFGPEIFFGGLGLLVAIYVYLKIKRTTSSYPLDLSLLFACQMFIATMISFGIVKNLLSYWALGLFLTFLILSLLLFLRKELNYSIFGGIALFFYTTFRIVEWNHLPGVWVMSCLILPIIGLFLIYTFSQKSYRVFWPSLIILSIDWLFQSFRFFVVLFKFKT